MFETMDKNSKTLLKNYLFFIATLFLMALVLTGFSFLGKKNWNNKLKTQVQAVLEKSRPLDFAQKLSVGDVVKINSTIAANSAMYKINRPSSRTEKYALITRVTTYYGPQAAVFLYDTEKGVSFEGFACINSRVEKQFDNLDSELIIKYWKDKAQKIFEAVSEDEGAKNE